MIPQRPILALTLGLLTLAAAPAGALASEPAIILPQPLPAEEAAAPAEAGAAETMEDAAQSALDLLMGQGGAVGGLTRVVQPYVIIVGGVEAEEVIQCAEDTPLGACMGAELKNEESGGTRQDRVTTLALSRFGFRGQVNEHVYFESEFEANAGRYGTSAWEGQAAIQVRNQLLRYGWDRGRVEVGRVTDLASIDFFSAHIADQLMMDVYIRGPLLSSGFNRGNGVLGVFSPVKGVDLGLTANAANPVSTTGSVMIGGTFPPFSRFYFAPYSNIGRDAASLPNYNFHIYILSPSVVVKRGIFGLRAAAQLFQADTSMATTEDENIRGVNLRASAQLTLLGGKLKPFLSASHISNDVVDPNDGTKLGEDTFRSTTLGAGVDVNYDGPNGVGLQYNVVQDQQGAGTLSRRHYINLGATRWVAPNTSLGFRGAYYLLTQDQEPDDAASAAVDPAPQGAGSLFVTLRLFI